jgi:hypothetical protein
MSVISEPVAQVRVTSPAAPAERPRWVALMLMVVLDTTIVSIALPHSAPAAARPG